MRKLLKIQNISLILLLGLFGHNLYLQIQVEKAVKASINSENEAKKATNKASAVLAYAREAAENSRIAAEYANEAAENSREAWNYAEDAAYNSFGSQCWSCPD